MSRCGCSTPCPPCPQNEFLDQLENNPELPSGVEVILLTRTFALPAITPGFGVNVEAELNAGVLGEQDAQVSFQLRIDGAGMQSGLASRAITIRTGGIPGLDSGSVFAGEAQLAPGNHTITFSAIKVPGSTSVVTVVGASMRTELVRVPNLTTSEQVA